MTAGDVVLILGAVGVLVTAVAGAVVTLRRVEDTKNVIREDVKAVHKIVNQQRTDMLAYQETLVEALQKAGIHVPRDTSV